MSSFDYIDDMIKNLPRLTPTWNGLTNSKFRGSGECFVDFGGTGVDVVLEENELKCKETKYLNDQCNYRATSCALPFLPANKVAFETDPCLTHLHEATEKCKIFTSSLRRARISFNSKKTKKFKNSVMLAHEAVHKMSCDRKFENFQVPETIARLAFDFPEKIRLPPINMSYAGGCLATSCSADGNHILLHPSGKKLNHLGVTIIEEAKGFDKHFRPISFLEKNPIKLKGGIILQISSSTEGYSYVRQKKSCHFVDFTNVQDISHSILIKEKELTSVASSPYNPQDYVVLYDNGELELKYLDISEPAWVLNRSQLSSGDGKINVPQCSFGSHPMSILYLDENEFCSFDTRLKQDDKKVLFSSLHPTCFIDESLISLKNCVGNYFQHVVLSNYHLFVCDERYPKKPILTYDHMLSSFPLYCDAATLSTSQDFSDVMILVGTQDSCELSVFSVRTQHSLVQPISLSPPLHLSSITDCIDSLQLHCIPVKDSLAQRLTHPLVGVSVVPHKNEFGFTAFQLNSLGDLFYQDFTKNPLQDVEKNFKVGLGCVLSPPERILPQITPFSCNIPVSKKECSEFSHSLLTELNVDLTNLFSGMKNIPEFCSVCNPDKAPTLVYPEENLTSLCPSCNFTRLQSENLSCAVQNLNLLSGSTNEAPLLEFDTSSFYEFDDNLSKNLLAIWDSNVVLETEVLEPGNSSSLSTSRSSSPSVGSYVSDLDMNNITPLVKSEDDISKGLIEDMFSINTLKSSLQFDNLEAMEDVVPPSQEVKPLVGETLRKLKKFKPAHKKIFGSGGF